MEITSSSKNRRPTKSIYLGILVFLIVAVFYWEFVYDTYSLAAIRYYDKDTKFSNSENAAFALLGIKAPKRINNFHSWAESNSIEAEQSSETLVIHTSDLNENYYCWLPWGESDPGKSPQCLSKKRLDELLKENQLALDRYSKVLAYSSLAVHQFGVMSHASIELSKQFSVSLWQKRHSFSNDDFESIINFYHFWNSVLRDGYLSGVGFAIASVNHGLAFGLLTATVTLYPEIIRRYGKSHGSFAYLHGDKNLIDRLNIGEFYLIDSELCISGELAFEHSYCKRKPFSLLFKPGRTLDQIYASRFRIEDCKKTKDPESTTLQRDHWLRIIGLIKRPGNYDGRYFLNQYRLGNRNCELLENLRTRNAQLGLLNLYLALKESSYTFAQINSLYEDKSELFLVPFSKDYYLWDANKKTLGQKNFWPEYEDVYSIPFR